MVNQRGHTKERLLQATVRLAADRGIQATTVQAIANEVGITEGAVYRHYRSKEELRWAAYEHIIGQMIEEKRLLTRLDCSIREKIREWVRLTFEYFDQEPAGFTYVLLTPHSLEDRKEHQEVMTAQGRLLMRMIGEAQLAGQVRAMPVEVAKSHFTGLMLNIPRLITEGELEGPAVNYVEEVCGAVWRVFNPAGNVCSEGLS